MGSAETVKEMHEGDAALDGGQMSHSGHVHALLHAGGAQLGEAGLPAGHGIGMVAEDGDGMGAHGTGRDMHDAGQHGTGNAVHGRDHQHQALGSGVGGGQGAGLQRTVHGAAGAGLGLHLHQFDGLAEQVFLSVCRPLVHMVCHGAGGRDGIDGSDLRECVGHIRGGFVTVHGFENFLTCHCLSSNFLRDRSAAGTAKPFR